MLVRITLERGKVTGAAFQFMRHNDKNETFFCTLKDETEALAEIAAGSAPFGTKLNARGDQVEVELAR